MQANPRSLDALFNSQLRYVVPMFQRLYVWQELPQWQTLWEDAVEKADQQLDGKSSNAHYLGAVIIEGVRPSSPREVKRFLVIDGQQRLTTLQLLFCAYRDHVRLHEWKTLDRATSRYLENADPDVMERPEEERYKLWPTTLNRTVFSDILSAGAKSGVEAKYPLIRLRRKRKPEPRSNLVEAYLFFAKSLEEWIAAASTRTGRSSEECAFAMLQALQQDFCVVEIALVDGDDSQEIFYSLNSQGRPLSQSDLLRSLVFMRAEKEKVDRDELFDEFWGKFETPYWSSEVKRGGRSYSRLDLGLRFFLMAKKGMLVDARRVNEEYRRWIAVKPPPYNSVREELADFTAHAEVYSNYDAVTVEGLPSTDLRRILSDLDVSTALPLVIFLELDAALDENSKRECLRVLESFIARRAITGEENKEYNKLFVEVVGAIRSGTEGTVKSRLTEFLLSGGGTTRTWPTDDVLIEKAISRPIAQELRIPALRLVLERLELAFRGKKSESTAIPAGLQVEHVMPQVWATHWPLAGKIIPPQVMLSPFLAQGELAELADGIRLRNARVQTLGNLSLLNGYLNPAASNGAFADKNIEYKHSVLRLNRYFDELEEWDEETIRERGRALGKALTSIWPRP